ncbi:hypothetical protein T439DRAFT_376279 [Meredithblackwellia eburnea MCA 4105]
MPPATSAPKRRRQLKSCISCWMAKKRCNQEIPCDRCIKKGEASKCSRGAPGTQHAGGGTDGAMPDTEDEHLPEAEVPITISSALPPSSSTIHSMSDTSSSTASKIKTTSLVEDDAQTAEAAKALGSLSGDGAGAFSFHGPGSLSAFLKSEMLPGSSSPLKDGFTRFDFKVVLPPRPLAEYLIELFYAENSLVTRFTVTQKRFFVPLFRSLLDYAEAAHLTPDIPLPLPTTLSFLTLSYIFLATSLQLLPDGSLPFVRQYCVDPKALEKRLGKLAKEALDLSETEEPPDSYRVEATLLLGLYMKNCGRPTVNYHYVAQAIRTAQAMGYHREGDATWGLSPLEAEMRRRLWWILFAYDRFSNLAFGRPYVISEHHCDTNLPANADISAVGLHDPTPIVSHPREHITPYTSILFEIELSIIVGRICDRCFSARPSSYKDVLDADRMLVEYEQRLPPAFRNPSLELLHEIPYLAADMQFCQLQLTWIRMVLHRPYLLRRIPVAGPDPFDKSRTAAISFAQKLLSVQRDLQMHLPRHLKRFFLVCFQTFDPTATLTMAILQDPTDAARVEVLDKWICEGLQMLIRMGDDNVVAKEGINCINAMRAKVYQVVPPGTQLGPLAPPQDLNVTLPYLSLSFIPAPSLFPSTIQPSESLPSVFFDHFSLPSPDQSTSSSSSNNSYSPDPVFPNTPSSNSASLSWLEDAQSALSNWPLGQGALESLSGGKEQWVGLLEKMGMDPQAFV